MGYSSAMWAVIMAALLLCFLLSGVTEVAVEFTHFTKLTMIVQ